MVIRRMRKRGFGLDQAVLGEIAALPFEKALAELEDIVTRLERGSVPLEESIAIYERGEALKKHCDALLRNAEMRIEKITLGADGQPAGAEPFDAD
jgi:exodeoxyribonuclease VII small subunit